MGTNESQWRKEMQQMQIVSLASHYTVPWKSQNTQSLGCFESFRSLESTSKQNKFNWTR